MERAWKGPRWAAISVADPFACLRGARRGTLRVVHALGDSLPYVIGFGSAVAVQIVTQVWLVPRAESRKRRDDRWLQDVLDLGELLTGPVRERAEAARNAQAVLLGMRNFPASTLAPDARLKERMRAIFEQEQAVRLADAALADLVDSRVAWLADRIIGDRADSKAIVPFVQASLPYRVYVPEVGAARTRGLDVLALSDAWQKEQERRRKMMEAVMALSLMRHPPRPTRSWQLARLRRRAAAIAARAVPWPTRSQPAEGTAAEAATESGSDPTG
jgi:hypothetical protein